MHTKYYFKLVGKTPVRCKDVVEWSLWFLTADRIVEQTYVCDYEVSTVFLGIDYSFLEEVPLEVPPLLFETIIVRKNSREKVYCKRFETWDEAVEGHEKAIEFLKT